MVWCSALGAAAAISSDSRGGYSRSESTLATTTRGGGPAEGGAHAAAATADVVGVHRLCQHDVGVGVEAAADLAGVVVEVALDGVAATAPEGVLGALGHPAEAVMQLQLAAVGDVGDAAGDPEPVIGPPALLVVVAAAEPRVAADRQQLGLAPGNLLGRRVGGRGQHDRGVDASGMGDRPLQGPHPAHRPAENRLPALDAEVVCEQGLDLHLVADRHEGEAAAPGPAVGGPRRRAGGSLAAAQHVGGHDEVACRCRTGSRGR